MKHEQLKLKTEFIQLDALLKFSGISTSGGQAKVLISEGNVKVNGEVCLMRGKKIRKGDTIEVDETIIEVL